MRRTRPFAACAAAVIGLSAIAGGAGANDTPLSVYLAALEHNAALQASRAGLDAEREATAITFGQLLPNLSLSSNISRNQVDRSLAGSPSERFDYNSQSNTLNLRQPIYRRYNLAAYVQSKSQVEAAEANFGRTRGELAVKVVSAYFDATYADVSAQLIEVQKTAVAAQADAAIKSFQAGAGTRIDVDEAKSKYDMVLAQEIEVHNQQINTRRALQALIARPVARLGALDPGRMLLLVPRPSDGDAWVAEAVAANPELAAARSQIGIAEQEVHKAVSGHHPTLDLVASVGTSGNDSLATLNRSGDVRFRQNIIGLQLSVPLYAGGQVNATVRQARAKLEQAKFQAEEIRRNLEAAVQREFDSLAQTAAKIQALQQAESSGQQTVQSVRRGVEAGVRSVLDVLQADQQLFSVRSDLARERYRHLLARLRLAALAGREAEPDLKDMNAWFGG